MCHTRVRSADVLMFKFCSSSVQAVNSSFLWAGKAAGNLCVLVLHKTHQVFHVDFLLRSDFCPRIYFEAPALPQCGAVIAI